MWAPAHSLTSSPEGLPAHAIKMPWTRGLREAMVEEVDVKGSSGFVEVAVRDMDSLKLIGALVATVHGTAFFHANEYHDTKGQAFGVVSGPGTLSGIFGVLLASIFTIDLGLLSSTNHIREFVRRFGFLSGVAVLLVVASMLLCIVSLNIVLFHSYSPAVAWGFAMKSA